MCPSFLINAHLLLMYSKVIMVESFGIILTSGAVLRSPGSFHVIAFFSDKHMHQDSFYKQHTAEKNEPSFSFFTLYSQMIGYTKQAR